MSYKTLLSIRHRKFADKKVLIIGAGWMARQYCIALQALGVKDVSIISRTESSSMKCAKDFGFMAFSGGYQRCISAMEAFDLVIIATPINELKPAAVSVIEIGNKNILIEKPGSLYAEELDKLKNLADEDDIRIRIAYNRLTYPSYWKLNELIDLDGGITSCRYTFTELIRSMDFEKEDSVVYQRWGIANSLHVISMAHSLIGMPRELSSYRHGGLPWHLNASRFVGSGITEKEISFSYHADWDSAGRWGIEIMTPENACRLIPLEKLYKCPKDSFEWEQVEFETPFPGVKEGLAEEISIMLDPSLEEVVPLIGLREAADYVRLAEKIFGYD